MAVAVVLGGAIPLALAQQAPCTALLLASAEASRKADVTLLPVRQMVQERGWLAPQVQSDRDTHAELVRVGTSTRLELGFSQTHDFVSQLSAPHQPKLEPAAFQELGFEGEQAVGPAAPSTPAYLLAMRWGGLSLGLIGGTLALGSYAQSDEKRSPGAGLDELRKHNLIGWSAFCIGAGAFASSYLLQSSPAFPATSGPRQAATQLTVGLGTVKWEGTF